MRNPQYTTPAFILANSFVRLVFEGRYLQAIMLLFCAALVVSPFTNADASNVAPYDDGIAMGNESASKSAAGMAVAMPRYDSGLFSPASSYVCAPHALSFPECSPITVDYVQQLFVNTGHEKHHARLAGYVMKAMDMGPDIGDYIRKVLAHFPGFRLMAVSANELSEFEALAAFLPGESTIFLPFDVPSSKYLISLIAHEFRHAMLNLVSKRKTGNPHSLDNYCHFPDTPDKRDEVARHLSQGDARVEALGALLDKQSQNKLSRAEHKELINLRKKHQSDYERYAGFVTVLPQAQSSKKAARQLFGHILIGDGVKYEVVGYSLMEGKIFPVIKCVDVLRAFYQFLTHRQERFTTMYHKDERALETDAHFVSSFPRDLLLKYYPEFLNATQALIQGTPFDTSICDVNRNNRLAVPSINSAHTAARAKLLSIPDDQFDLATANRALPDIQASIERGDDLDQCWRLALKIRKKGFEVTRASLMLADIAFQRQDHNTALYYYEKANDGTQQFNLGQLVRYADSFLHLGEYERAKDFSEKILSNPFINDPENKPHKARSLVIKEEADSYLREGAQHGM